MAFDNELLEINWSEPFDVAAPANASDESIPDDCMKCLQKSFGHTRFREMQWKIISSILEDARDNCVIMATGYGKSLCFQFPSVYRDTITIVVSPLISLMQDQVHAMCFYNLRACFLGSAQTKRETVHEVIDRQYNIVYVTPEYITSDCGDSLMSRIQDHVTLIAIDEAHCISKWGHDFRSAYRSLRKLRTTCPSVPILAMTATATEQVRDDIIENLGLRNPQIISTGFDRPNLEFIVKRKTSVWADIGPHIENVKIGSVIVYCISRRVTEEVADIIREHGQLCGTYHAGLSLKKRQQTHDDFIHDRIRVVVATIAFGMGINKPDVRLVIHYGVSKDLEGYYQEVGRAGRDGLPAKCLMFHCERDWSLHRLIRERCKLDTSKEQMEKLMMVISKYVDTKQCRRRFILMYFGEDCSKLTKRRDCCDNCRRLLLKPALKLEGLDENGLLDITDESIKLMKLLRDMRSKFGLGKAILVLRGSQAKSVPVQFARHELFGCMKDKSEKWLQAVARSLMHLQLLAMDASRNSFAHTLAVTSEGHAWLNGIQKRGPIKIEPGEDFIRLLKPIVVGLPKILQPRVEAPAENRPTTSAAANSAPILAAASSTTAPDIYRPLLKVRSKLASLFDAMPYLVASTRALQQLAKIQPTTMEEFRRIRLDGYTEEKTERFGPVFLKVIKDFHSKFGKPTNLQLQLSQPTEVANQNQTADNNAGNAATTTAGNVQHLLREPLADVTPNNGEPAQNLPSTQGSVDIIEPTPPPLIVIDPEVEEAIFADWDSDTDDKDLSYVGAQVEKQLSTESHRPDSTNNELDLLIDAMQGDEFKEPTEIVKTSRVIAKSKKSSTLEYESESNSDADLFDGDWDLDIDDSDLTQVSEKVEQELKFTPPGTSAFRKNGERKSELDQLIEAINEPTTSEITDRRERKPRIIERKKSEVFEYEDDSSSDSDNEKNLVSPKKRALPSWMQLANKRKR